MDGILKLEESIPGALRALGVGSIFYFSFIYLQPYCTLLPDSNIGEMVIAEQVVQTAAVLSLVYILGIYCIIIGEMNRKIVDKQHNQRLIYLTKQNENTSIRDFAHVCKVQSELLSGAAISIQANALLIGGAISVAKAPIWGGLIAVAAIPFAGVLIKLAARTFSELDMLIGQETP